MTAGGDVRARVHAGSAAARREISYTPGSLVAPASARCEVAHTVPREAP